MEEGRYVAHQNRVAPGAYIKRPDGLQEALRIEPADHKVSKLAIDIRAGFDVRLHIKIGSK